MRSKVLGLLVALCFMFGVSTADAQSFERQGSIEASAGVGVTTVLDDEFVADFSDVEEEAYVASLRYWVTSKQNLGVTLATVSFPQRLYQVDADYRYNFRTDKRFVPFVGANGGWVNEGLVTNSNKWNVGLAVGATYYFDRLGVFVESRTSNMFDKDVSDVSVNSLLGRFTVGVTLLAR